MKVQGVVQVLLDRVDHMVVRVKEKSFLYSMEMPV